MTSAPSIHLTRLLEPHEYRDSFNHVRDRQRPHDYHWPTAYLPPIDGDVTNTIRLPTKVNTIWCSAAGPQTYHAVFAVGTSRGAAFVALSNVAVHSWVLDYTWPDKGRSHDTLALDFWTESNLLCGMRSGKVRLWDMRANGSNVRFRHGSCVSHIRVVGENKVLVAGLENRVHSRLLYNISQTLAYSSFLSHSSPFTTSASSNLTPNPTSQPRKA